MKKTFLTFTISLLFTVLATSMSAQYTKGQAKLVNKARAAAATCINPYVAQGLTVKGQVEDIGICFVSGTLHKVTFYATVPCSTPPCPKPVATYVATVYFDCSDKVTLVECAK